MKNKFNVGDLVKVVNHEWRGWTGFYGIIITVGRQSRGIRVLLAGFSSGSRMFKKRNLQLLAKA